MDAKAKLTTVCSSNQKKKLNNTPNYERDFFFFGRIEIIIVPLMQPGILELIKSVTKVKIED